MCIRDSNIYVQHLNCIQSAEWATGLAAILKRLRRDKVPQFHREFNAKKVTSWWQSFRSAKAGVKRQPDKYWSNWFPIASFPQHIYLCELEAVDEKFPVVDFDMPFLCAQRGPVSYTHLDVYKRQAGKQGQGRRRIHKSVWARP